MGTWHRADQAIPLQSLKSDVWDMDEELAEDSCTFQAAMVLLASDMVGPYTDRVATFLGYRAGFVQVIAARLIEARVWDNDEVSAEPWLDPLKGDVSFMLDLRKKRGNAIITCPNSWPFHTSQFD